MTEEVRLSLLDGSVETLTVSSLGNNQYRLEDTPLSTLMGETEVHYGDIIEAEAQADGVLHLRRVVSCSNLKMTEFIVSRDVVESPAFDAFLQMVVAAGGYAERLFGGVLLVYVPTDSSFDPRAELDKVATYVMPRVDDSSGSS